MHLSSTLRVRTGQATDAGAKPANEDSMGLLVPRDNAQLTHKGVAAVIADGVSAADAGREAADTSVQNFLNDYFSTPDTWTVETSALKVISALNSWLYSKSAQFTTAQKGFVCTLTVLIVKSRTAHIFHVGDTRVYLRREGKLRQLTRDHAIPVAHGSTYLSRAMGLDSKLQVDHKTVALQPGDLFLLTTDGIHDHLSLQELVEHLTVVDGPSADPFEDVCQTLIASAREAGSPDNLTAQVVSVDGLPDADADEYLKRLAELPFPPELGVGSTLDGFEVVAELHASRRSQLYLVKQLDSPRQLVMKTPSVNYEDDPAYIERFMLEHWISTRVKSKHLLRGVEAPAARSCLYNLAEYIEGSSLRGWINERKASKRYVSDLNVVVDIIGQVVRGLMRLHRKEILHQDLKPANIMLGGNGAVRIIDYGSCSVAGIAEIDAPITRDKILGTVSYSAPEYALGLRPKPNADLYALGCIAYEMLTGKHPYGETAEEATSRSDFDKLRYTAAFQHNPHIPLWLDGALKRAVKIDPQERYQELSEFIYDLENPNPNYLGEQSKPLLERVPRTRWKTLALLLLFTQAVTLVLLVQIFR